MRSLKKLITMLLALAMILTSLGVPAFAASFSDITDEKVAEAVDKLVGYKVITGYEDGTFKPDNQITRAEFAAIVTRMKGVTNLSTDAVTGFSDLDNDTSRAWARPYVKAAVDLKIINGFEDGTFRAGEPVTYEQAVKMLVCAIGYEVVANSELNKIKITNPNASWSAGYIAAANKQGITKGVITSQISQPASRGVVAVLTSNSYEVPKLNVTTNENGDTVYEKEDSTIADEQYNTQEKIEGTVSGTYYTSLTEQAPQIALNQLEITVGSEKTVYDMSSELSSKTDLENILGKRVTAYYAKDERALVSIVEKNNSVVKVSEQYMVRPLSGMTLKYYNENDRITSASLSGYTFIYNGKSGVVSDLDTLESMFDNGFIEINESSQVAKITSFEVGVVSSYEKESSTKPGKINFKYGQTSYDVPTGNTSKPQVYVNGTKTEFSSMSLAAYDVVNILESPSGSAGNKLKKLYVTKGAKTGTVTSQNDVAREVDLDNKIFYLTNQYINFDFSGSSTDEKAPFDTNERYTYYLDYTGQIAGVKYSAASQGSYKYGYLSYAGKDSDRNTIVKIVSVETGKTTQYTITSSIKIDGTAVKESSVEDALKAVKTQDSIKDTFYDGSYSSDTAQPVRFMVSGTTLKAIDTLATGQSDSNDNFTKLINGNADSTVSESSIKQGTTTCSMLSSTTKVLYVPDDVSDDISYAKLTTGTAFRVSGAKRVEAFNVGTDKIAPFVIVYGAANPSHIFTATSPYMIVKKINHTSETMEITGYKNASTSETTISVNSEYYKGTAISGAISDYESVSKGDLIRYIENNGEVVAIEIWYDADNPTQKADYVDSSNPVRVQNKKVSGDSDSRYFRYGMVYAASDESKLVALSKYIPSDSVEASVKADSVNAKYFKCNSAKVYELDSNGNVSVLESLASISGYDENSNSADIAIMVTPYDSAESNAYIVYVINN